MFRVNKAIPSVILSGLIVFTGCASLVNSTKQVVRINSTPAGAEVFVDDTSRGVTPISTNLKRKQEHTVRIAMSGYEPYQIVLKRHYSGWLWGNVLIGGLIGLAIDAGTGGLYKLTPKEVNASMNKGTALLNKDGSIMIMTVLKPEPSWKKIGQLVPIERAG